MDLRRQALISAFPQISGNPPAIPLNRIKLENWLYATILEKSIMINILRKSV